MQTTTNTNQSPPNDRGLGAVVARPTAVVHQSRSKTDPKIIALDLQGSEFLSSHRHPTSVLFSIVDPLVDFIVGVFLITDQ